jgi:hypothetical protein
MLSVAFFVMLSVLAPFFDVDKLKKRVTVVFEAVQLLLFRAFKTANVSQTKRGH